MLVSLDDNVPFPLANITSIVLFSVIRKAGDSSSSWREEEEEEDRFDYEGRKFYEIEIVIRGLRSNEVE